MSDSVRPHGYGGCAGAREADIMGWGLLYSCSSLSCVRLFVTPWIAAHQASLSFIISWSLLQLMSIELVMQSNYIILCHPSPSALSLSQHQGLFQ